MHHITATASVSVTNFMNVGDAPFALDVVAHGATVKLIDVVVIQRNPCVVVGKLTFVGIDDSVVDLVSVSRIFYDLAKGPLAIAQVTSEWGGYPFSWEGGELPGSKTFALRDFVRRIVTAIEAAIHAPVAA